MSLGFSGTTLSQTQATKLCQALWYYFTRGVVFLHVLCESEADKYASEYWSKCGGKTWCHKTQRVDQPHCSLVSVSSKPHLELMLDAHTLITTSDSHLASHATYVLEKDTL